MVITIGRHRGTVRSTNALDYALDVVEAARKEGLLAVPVKPTTEMLTAGAEAGNVSVETAWIIYSAMIAHGG